MQFLLFDVSATLVFLVGYFAVVALHERRTMAVMAVVLDDAPRGARLPSAPRDSLRTREAKKDRPTEQCCREWPRLSAPR